MPERVPDQPAPSFLAFAAGRLPSSLKRVLKRSAGLALYGSPLRLGQTAARLAEAGAASRQAQILLWLQYRALAVSGGSLPSLRDVGFRVYSQSDEDGILLCLFALLGTTNRRVIEICAGDGIECNSANLIINHGWDGLLFDGKVENVQNGRAFYDRCQDTFLHPPQFIRAWIDADSVSGLVESNGFRGEIDLLAIDLDGVDYWIWKALDSVQPRVVVIEYQAFADPRSVTVPYRSDFDRHRAHIEYYGASLHALCGLARSRGYRLVGSNRYQFNAFFVRNGIGDNVLPAVDPSTCLDHPRVVAGQTRYGAALARYPWVEV